MAAKFLINSGPGVTWDNTNDTIWSLSSGGANNTTHPVAGDTVTLDGASGGGVVTVNANLSTAGWTTSAFTGTLDFATNNNNVTLSGGWTDAATGVHTINLGNGTWTFTSASGNTINFTAGANLTLNANGSTILLSAVPTGTRTISFGGRTLNNVTVTNASWQPFNISLNATTGTIAGALTLTNVGMVQWATAAAITITGAITWDGNTVNQGVMFAIGTAATLTVAAANTLSWLLLNNITKAGAGSITVNNGFDGGGNTGITINMPQRLLGGGMVGGMRG